MSLWPYPFGHVPLATPHPPTAAEPFPAMIRLPARLVLAASAALAPAAMMAAQQSPGTFSLPSPRPAPTPAPAGPADELAGVPIPPRAVPRTVPTPRPTATPTPLPTAAPRPQPTTAPSAALSTPVRTAPAPSPAPSVARPGTVLAPAPTAPVPSATTAPAPLPTASGDPLALPPGIPGTLPETGPVAAAPTADNTDALIVFSAWELIAAGGLGALALLGGGLLLWRRRKPKVLRLAAPSASGSASASGAAAAREAERAPDLADLHLSLDVTTATRSVMMFTVGYRLNIANRSGRAVSDMRIAVQLVCARANGANAPSAGAAQTLGEAPRIGPHQARSITGEVQIPLSAIQPLRQGTTPLFVPLVHVTIEAEGQPALTKTFVIGTPSSSGRVHPIKLDQPPGGIAGLVAQAVAVPSASAAA